MAEVGDKVTFIHDYKIRIRQDSNIVSEYHFPKGTEAIFLRSDDKGVILHFPHGEFRVPYKYLNVKKPPPPSPPLKSRFNIIDEYD